MLLPATGVELPTDAFEPARFIYYKEESTPDRLSFELDILHKESGLVICISNNGRNDENDYGVCSVDRETPVSRKQNDEILAEWDAFTVECIPTLRNHVKRVYADWPMMRDSWDDDTFPAWYLRDGVANFLIEEMQIQNEWSRKRKVIVRRPDAATGEHKLYTYATTKPAELMGRVDGEYWDKKTKNWIQL